MAKPTKKLIEARINRAVVGFQIPMLAIPYLYRELTLLIEHSASDAELRDCVAQHPGVVEV